MELWLPAVTIIGIYTLALISPGPNFLVISRNALAHSRRIGLQTALGVASGSILWITLGLFGVAVFFSKLPLLFTAVKIVGATYLVYTAFKLLRAQFGRRPSSRQAATPDQTLPANDQAFRHGLLTQMSNPKAAVFILALFSSAVSPATPPGLKLILALVMTAVSFSWYLSVAVILSRPAFQTMYGRFQRPTNLAFAGLLLILAANVIFSG